MRSRLRFLLAAATAAGLSLAGAAPHAQPAPDPIGDLIAAPASTPAPAVAPPPAAPSISQSQALSQALDAARTRQPERARALQALLTDPVARKLVDWALVDVMGDRLPADDLHLAVAALEGWPREDARLDALSGSDSEAAALPSGPIPYNALATDPRSSTSGFRGARLRMIEALQRGDAAAAYQAISNHGQSPGSVDYAEGESFAGWLALNKLRNAAAAEQHFARLEAAVRSPVSKARAAYWRGRTAEFVGDHARAAEFYERGAQHTTTFYGQLAAEKAGRRELVLTPDPKPSAADIAGFEAREMTRAIRLLALAGDRNLVRVFALHFGEQVQTEVELAMLVDMLKSVGEQEVSLLAYRRGAQRGLILHERGYPVMTPPWVEGGAEPALVLAITRQESQFDPRVRSHANARGMMQIIPDTGRAVARRLGVSWSPEVLWDASTNMQLGSRYLGELTERFGGSYVMAAAGYNAGPNRPASWVAFCGDPRSPSADPLDFIECIPFSETRNYVMNVMSNAQMYRARLGAGRAQLNLDQMLRRGSPPWAVTAAMEPRSSEETR